MECYEKDQLALLKGASSAMIFTLSENNPLCPHYTICQVVICDFAPRHQIISEHSPRGALTTFFGFAHRSAYEWLFPMI